MHHDQTTEPTPPSFRSILKLESKRASVYTVSTFITQFGSFLVVPLFWQKFSPSDYGVIAVTEIIGAVLGVIFGVSLDSSVTRFYYEWPEQERKRRVGAIWVASWISSIVLGCVSLFLLSQTNHLLFPDVQFYPFIFLGLIVAILKSFMLVPIATIRIKQLPGLYSIVSIASFIVQMSLSIYFVIILDQQLMGYFVANIISNSIIAVVSVAIMLRFAVPCIRGAGLRESLKFSMPIIPANLLSSVSSVVDRFVLQQFVSLENLGIYAISLKFTNLIILFHSALKLSYVPFMVESLSKNRPNAIRDLTQMSMFYVLPILMIGLAIMTYAKDFVYFANRSEYLPVIQWIPWLILPAILQTLNVYFTPGLFLSKRTDLMWIPAVIQMVAILASGLLLIPNYQMEGAVITRYCSAMSFFAISFVMSEKYFPIQVNWIKVLLLMVIMVSGMIVLSFVEFKNIVVGILAKAFFIASFGMVCLVIIVGLSSCGRNLQRLKTHAFERFMKER
jgi:O-antigen/teichoic acid export membrane protein